VIAVSTAHAFDELAVAWALDALESAESAVFVEHVRGCERCSCSVADARETAALLAFALVPKDIATSGPDCGRSTSSISDALIFMIVSNSPT
jgi:hypothetical protein